MIPKENLEFLKDIKKNNNREWFLTNKKRYEAYKEEYYALVQQMLTLLKKEDPSMEPLEVKDCVFRINRDIRFSKDKSPYKTNMAFWFSPGRKNANRAGYYVHIEPGQSFIAGGFYQPDNDELKKIRKEIAFFHDELAEILNDKKFKAEFGAMDRDNALKTAPKGYEKDHPAIHWLQLKSFTVTSKIDDKFLSDKDFVKKTVAKLLMLKPFAEFFNRAVTSED